MARVLSCRAVFGAVLAGLVSLSSITKAAEEESPFKPPQPAVLQFRSGRVFTGTLVKVDAKGVTFKLNRAGVAAAVYKLDVVFGIRTADGTFLYNPKTKKWESLKAKKAPAKKGPEDPGEEETPRKRRTKPGEEDESRAEDADPPRKSPRDKDPDALEEVVVEAVGLDYDKALNDALRAAVRKVAGTLVVSKTTVKEDELIEDKVLTSSDGVVKTYDELGQKKIDGLVRLKIRAKVERRQVADRLIKAGIKVKAVDGAGLAAAAKTRLEARRRASEMLQDALAGLPKVLVADAKKPTADDYDEEKQEMKVVIGVKPDGRRY
jgi:hypothetical protein